MPFIEAGGGVRLHYVERGTGGETVVFSHSYLVDHRHFESQITALEDRYRVIAFDHRDHGQSDLAPATYTLDDLVRDGVSVIEQTGAAPCHWVGLSSGGFVGVRIALRHRELLRSLTLMDTSAEAERWYHKVKYEGMFAVLRAFGARPLMGSVMAQMFSPATLRDPDKAAMLRHWREHIVAQDREALIRFGRAIFRRDDILGELPALASLPVLVMAGERDRATPPRLASRIAGAIPGARLRLIPRAGHLSTLEQPERVNTELLSFLERAQVRLGLGGSSPDA